MFVQTFTRWRFDVDEEADVVFARHRRETVSLWALNSELNALQTTVGMVSSAVATDLQQDLATKLEALRTELKGSMSGQSDLVSALLKNFTDAQGDLATRALVSSTVSTQEALLKQYSETTTATAASLQKAYTDSHVASEINNLKLNLTSSLGQLPENINACTAAIYGSIRFNKSNRAVEFCLDEATGWTSQLTKSPSAVRACFFQYGIDIPSLHTWSLIFLPRLSLFVLLQYISPPCLVSLCCCCWWRLC